MRATARLRRGIELVLAVLVAGGCLPSSDATVPVRQVQSGMRGPSPTGCLVVFLPGLGDEPEEYVDNGFTDLLSRARVDSDVTAVDAHFGYYRQRSVIDRLHQDVVLAARARGYDRIWLVGISLGGLGALGYAAAHPSEVAGVVLLSPYMGSFGLVREIEASGGLRAWSAERDLASLRDGDGPWYTDSTRFFRYIWTWASDPRRPDGSRVPIYLGYGRYDSLAPMHELLAEVVPPEHRLVAYGGHEWPVWRDLWQVFSQQGFLQRSCGRAGPPERFAAGSPESGP